MSLVKPSFSHAFLKRRSICSAVSFPRLLTLIIETRSFHVSLHNRRMSGSFPLATQIPSPRHCVDSGERRSVPQAIYCSSGGPSFGPHTSGFMAMAEIRQIIRLRVRYTEVDAMGYVHHSRFFQYFEMGRIELLRSQGHSYADLEREGVYFVVVKAQCQFKAPARYD